ncbi:universal stress protein [Conexibacter stalactiti]|uniref:Universal stress protein n=1 Tax=Conexibacter stalactiti TaxID=1940611 RepID=A0ABU4HPA5_9ACTN|nr:universal stress protein [Conexibacter stalactiti]MDW5595089.1 universal stress protein [Conexibacter stalactiti]MEC5035731.1 universal stress protein [Conexibacter stalactiti]
MSEPRALVVGFDDSDGARAALHAAIELARELGDRLVIVFGYEPPGRAGEEHGAAVAAARELGERVTRHALARAEVERVPAEVVLVEQRPVDALLSQARVRDARMIVIGSAREHPFKGALVGSTPHRLLHLADRPVLAVPAGPI